MDIIKIIKTDRKWYEIILWWEIRRIPYNIMMYFIGLASFYIAYVTIPLIYIGIGFLLNVGYTFCWIAEIVLHNQLSDTKKMVYPRITFCCYLALSTMIVFGVAMLIFLP